VGTPPGTPPPPPPAPPPPPPSAAPAPSPPPNFAPPPPQDPGPVIRRRANDIVRPMMRPGANTPASRRDSSTRPGTPKPGSPRTSGTRTPAAPAPAPASPAPDQTAAGGGGSGVVELPGEKEFNQCKKLPAGKRIVKFNFKPDSEIADLVGWISSISCTQFLIAGPTLQGKKVTVLSPQLITPEEAYRLFLGALESVGLTVEPMGKFLRIVETGRARFTNLPFYKDGEEPAGGDKRYVTRLFRFDNLDANDVLTNLYNQVRGEQGVGVAYSGSLIVTDQAVMLERFGEIVKELDVPSIVKEKIWMVRVKNTSASEMASRLAEIFQVQQMGAGGRRTGGGAPMGAPPPPPPAPGAGARPPPKSADLAAQLTISKLIPDERSNTLIVVANERAYEWLLTIMKKLDVPIEGGGDGRFHIYSCEHANCDELAGTLAAITGVSFLGGGQARRTARTAVPGAAPQAPVPGPTGPGAQGQMPPLFEGDVRLTFDGSTNSLVIFSSLKDFQSLRKVIIQLDLPRKQVYVEAMIMEVLLDKTRDLGVAYHGGFTPSIGGEQSVVLGGFDANKTLSPQSLAGDLLGLSGAVFGPALGATARQLFGQNVDIPSFGAFVKILQKNNDVNVLSTPHLLITNNQEGEISVGQNLPFPGSLLGGFGGLGAQAGGLGSIIPQVSVQRQDVSLRMKLLPSVNEHNMIKLDVDVEISDLAATNFNGLGPATTKRTAKTPVFCKDQQTVVIGGLMSDRVTDTVHKIPILGDIPVLGFFFRNSSKQIQKTNIIIALTPYVISDMEDLRRVAEKKMRERREFIERFSAIEDNANIESNIDYRRKRGMLEEINRTAREIDEEEQQLRLLRERDLQDESSPIELPSKKTEERAPTKPRPTRGDSFGKPEELGQEAPSEAAAKPTKTAAVRREE
jgi:general secretion pathway protein D